MDLNEIGYIKLCNEPGLISEVHQIKCDANLWLRSKDPQVIET